MNGKRNIKEWKKNLRARHRQTRERVDPKKKLQWDAAIENRLFALPEYRRADVLFTYVSKAIEVDTFGIIRRALADGKAVAVPRCVPGTFEMAVSYTHLNTVGTQCAGDLPKKYMRGGANADEYGGGFKEAV